MGFAFAAPFLANSSQLQDTPGTTSPPDEIEHLKAQLRTQQEQIEDLRRRLDDVLKRLSPVDAATATPPASSQAPPASPPVPAPPAQTVSTTTLPNSAPSKGPLSLEIGAATFTPTGFIDFAQVWRSATVTSGLPTYFAAIPYSNTVFGNRRQTLSSAANSRLGLQVNTHVLGFDVLGVAETDFNGYIPNSVATTSNSYGLRLRLAFADLTRHRWEVLVGQNWSLLTPARDGISPSVDSLFLTQDLDPNIQSGLVWARVPQLRLVFHATPKLAMAASFESADTYAGGSAGSGTITLPTGLAPNYFGQVDTSTENGNSVPNPNLDWIAKVTYDTKPIHLEVAGLVNRFAFYNPMNNRSFDIVGGGVTFTALVKPTRHLTLITSNYYTNGGGSYIFGEAPDLIIQANGAPSLLPAGSTVDGIEYTPKPKWIFFSYYGGTWIDRISTFDPATSQPVGYGYEGSPNSQNRTVQEVSAGFHHIFFQNPNYGTFRFSCQFSWINRHAWYVAPGQPSDANFSMMYFGFRYFLPGSAPELK